MDGYEIVIYLHDHAPPHLHVQAHGREAIINLFCPDGELQLTENFHFKRRELKRALECAKQHQQQLCQMWRVIHGNL